MLLGGRRVSSAGPGSAGAGVASAGGVVLSGVVSAGGALSAGADGAGVGLVAGADGVVAAGPAGVSPSTGLAGVSPVTGAVSAGGSSSARDASASASAVRPDGPGRPVADVCAWGSTVAAATSGVVEAGNTVVVGIGTAGGVAGNVGSGLVSCWPTLVPPLVVWVGAGVEPVVPGVVVPGVVPGVVVPSGPEPVIGSTGPVVAGTPGRPGRPGRPIADAPPTVVG